MFEGIKFHPKEYDLLILKIIEWAQKNQIKVEGLTKNQIKEAMKIKY